GDLIFGVLLVDGKVQGAGGTNGMEIYAPLVENDRKPGARVGVSQQARDGFRKVRKGMTEEQVVALMGKPTLNVKIALGKELTYTGINNEFITVRINDGKVLGARGWLDRKKVTLSD